MPHWYFSRMQGAGPSSEVRLPTRMTLAEFVSRHELSELVDIFRWFDDLSSYIRPLCRCLLTEADICLETLFSIREAIFDGEVMEGESRPNIQCLSDWDVVGKCTNEVKESFESSIAPPLDLFRRVSLSAVPSDPTAPLSTPTLIPLRAPHPHPTSTVVSAVLHQPLASCNIDNSSAMVAPPSNPTIADSITSPDAVELSGSTTTAAQPSAERIPCAREGYNFTFRSAYDLRRHGNTIHLGVGQVWCAVGIDRLSQVSCVSTTSSVISSDRFSVSSHVFGLSFASSVTSASSSTPSSRKASDASSSPELARTKPVSTNFTPQKHPLLDSLIKGKSFMVQLSQYCTEAQLPQLYGTNTTTKLTGCGVSRFWLEACLLDRNGT